METADDARRAGAPGRRDRRGGRVLNLPDASGTDVIVSLRERAPEVPVIVVGDGEAEPSDVRRRRERRPAPRRRRRSRARAIRYAATLRKVEAGLRRNQAFDELTGLLNARGFDLLANHHFRLADRSKDPCDHPVPPGGRGRRSPGDPAVADAATVISSAVRVTDVVARVGSGAFRVLLAGASTGTEPIVLERIVEAVAAHNAKAGRDAGPSISVGAASYDPEHPIALEEPDRRGRSPDAAPVRHLGHPEHPGNMSTVHMRRARGSPIRARSRCECSARNERHGTVAPFFAPRGARCPRVTGGFRDGRPLRRPRPELVQRIRRGDGEAFRGLFGRYAPSAMALARRVVRQPFLAEEIVQERSWRCGGTRAATTRSAGRSVHG